ncbi:MAG: hypothetical protein ACK58L_17735, partial [Planctomycetota bacterium]
PGVSVVKHYFDPKERKSWIETTGVAQVVNHIQIIGSQVIQSTYDETGRLKELKDLLTGAKTNHEYTDVRLDLPTKTTKRINTGVEVEDAVEEWKYAAAGQAVFNKKNQLLGATETRYDELGYVKSQTSLAQDKRGTRNGGWYQLTTSSAGDVIESIDARMTRGITVPYLTSYDYDESGRVRLVIDPLTNDTRLTSMGTGTGDDEAGATPAKTVISFDSGLVQAISTDRTGVISVQWRNDVGQLVKSLNPHGAIETREYDLNGNVRHVRLRPASGDSAIDRHTEYRFDALDRLRETIQHDTRPTTTLAGIEDETQGSIQLRYTAVDNASIRSTTDYFLPGQVAGGWNVVESLPHLISAARDAQFTKSALDSAGNPIKSEQPPAISAIENVASLPSTTTSYQYSYNASLGSYTVEEVTDRAKATDTSYSERRFLTTLNTEGVVLRQTQPQYKGENNQWSGLLSATEYRYDVTGLRIQQNDSSGFGWRLGELDAATGKAGVRYTGQIVKPRNALAMETFVHDSAGNLVQYRDNSDNSTEYIYDALGRLVREAGKLENPITHSLADTTRRWVFAGNTRVFVDRDGRTVWTKANPSTRTVDEYWYPSDVQLALNASGTATPPPGFITRITSVFDSLGQQTSANKAVTGSDAGTAVTTFAYDEFGRSVREVQSATFMDLVVPTTTISRDFSAIGLPSVSQTSVNGAGFDGVIGIQKYFRDSLGRIIANVQDLKSGAGSAWRGASVGQDKRLESVLNPDGSPRSTEQFASVLPEYDKHRGTTVYNYNSPAGLLSRVAHFTHAGQVSEYVNTYFSASDQTPTFFPQPGKLKDQSVKLFKNGVKTYSDVTSYKYDDLGQLNEITRLVNGVASTKTPSFDTRGNRTGTGFQFASPNRLIEDQDFKYEYDREGRLTRRTSKYVGQVFEERTRRRWVDGFGDYPGGYITEEAVYNKSRDFVNASGNGAFGGNQDIYIGTSFNARQWITVPSAGEFDVWITYSPVSGGAEVPFDLEVGGTRISGVIDFAGAPDDIVDGGIHWKKLGRIRTTGPVDGLVTVTKTAANTGVVLWDAFRVTSSTPHESYDWDHEGNLIEIVSHIGSATSETRQTVSFHHDALGRLVARHDAFKK